ncbi:MAG: DUF3572 domain-containing protein [Pseudomonadota bacterium]
MQRDYAETLALEVLGWLAGEDDLLPVFLGSTGTSLTDLKERASDPEFLGAVLDFVVMDDAWVLAFSEAKAVPPTALSEARALLPGGNLPHWT